ncbi:neuropeptide prohormone-4-like [Tubulanus polymorphus]|uniref:neuropeptide prohormone-4-like n=1 Tax=Tubulanus polymorphus TaxID=672921 RepID=UPI003DA2AD4C
MKSWEPLLVLTVVIVGCASMKIDLEKLLARHPKYHITQEAHKRKAEVDFNPCDEKEKPWPCKSANQCISMEFVCDENFDCRDGSDEDEELCTAAVRPPVDDMVNFIRKEKGWILPHLLGNAPVSTIVHNLAVSQTIDDFRHRVNLNRKQYQNLKDALEAIANDDQEPLLAMGMPSGVWSEVKFLFDRLIKSGFYR